MKNILLSTLFCFLTLGSMAQTAVNNHLTDAKKYYSSSELQEARNSLNQSIAELDVLICKEIMAALPKEINGMPYKADEDYVAGNALALTGTTVQRTYQAGEMSMNVNMINNSPMMTMLTAFLTNPLLANSADGSQKQVKIAGHKAVLQKNMETEGDFTLQIPLNESLMTIEYTRFSEQEVLQAAEGLNLPAIIEIIN